MENVYTPFDSPAETLYSLFPCLKSIVLNVDGKTNIFWKPSSPKKILPRK